MLLSLLLFETEFLHIVAISFTALVINELIMVALEVTTWHTYMILSELGTALIYLGSMAVLPAYFGESAVGRLLSAKESMGRPGIRAVSPVRLQGLGDRGSLELPAVCDQCGAKALQAGCVCEGGWDLRAEGVSTDHLEGKNYTSRDLLHADLELQ